MDWAKLLLYLLENHKGKIIGVILGLLFGICIVAGGFWAAVVILVCILVGYYLGKKSDDKVDFKEVVEKIFNKQD
ncbi:MAG: DUF2273 domain-containing protein [Bacillota bacterium]|jgi:uncharacterized membrane protein